METFLNFVNNIFIAKIASKYIRSLSSREYYNSLQRELLVSSQLLCWDGKESLRSIRVKELVDVVNAQSRRLIILNPN